VITPLSVLDTQWPGVLTKLVCAREAMGYRRYWAARHHSPRQSASPTLVAALAAGVAHKMRVGTAGVLLRLTSPMRIAEDFAALELYFPGRIDLGIAGAGAGNLYEQQYAPDVILPTLEGFADRLRRTVALVRNGLESETGPVAIGPASIDDDQVTRPQLWLCGTGPISAELAGTLGMRFAFHHYLAMAREDARQVVESYRAAFVPYGADDAPYVAVAGFGSCAPTLAEAEAEWRGHFTGQSALEPTFLGTPDACADRLAALADRYGANELVVDCFTTSLSTRLSALELLARTFR